MVEISRKNLLHNLKQFRKRIGKKVKLMTVVKANAYGHGILEVSKIVSHAGADWLGVNSLQEGIILREKDLKLPILVMGDISLKELKEAIKNKISFVAYNQETIERANEEGKKLETKAKVHLKLETGTNRLGIGLENILPFIKFCLSKKHVLWEGIYTHYANIEDTLDHGFAVEQLKNFKNTLRLIKSEGIKIPLRHTACTAATILFKETFFDLVRVGIGLYGLWPSRETKISAKEKKIKFDLRPVLTWKTKIAQIKPVAKSETVGYGRSFKTARETKIAVLPVGYYEGYDRKLSNCGRVLIRSQFAPVIGRVCMNMMMVDVTDISGVKPDTEVVLLGKQGKNEIPAEELAQKIGTINYEVVSRINPLLPRKVV